MNRWASYLLLAAVALFEAGCANDPHIVRRPDNLREDRSFLSAPVVRQPIYACASSVVVEGFVPGARVDVFADGNPTPIGSARSWLSSQLVTVSAPFVVGQRITARQIFDSATSGPSNQVAVTSHLDDYPSGLPTPRSVLRRATSAAGPSVSRTPCQEPGSKCSWSVQRQVAASTRRRRSATRWVAPMPS